MSEYIYVQRGRPVFDCKYTTIVKHDYTPEWIEMIDWTNENSLGDVDVKFDNQHGQEAIYLGFEDSNDALVFRIRYL
jgi:hypothetical protein